ncbi:LURP-one-related family protein, partial [Clostridium tertium]
MKYYMKSKVFKLKEDFWIKDTDGNDIFFVDNKLISLGLQFNIQKDNKILYEIKQKMSLKPKYEVIKDSEVIASINKKLTFIK